MKILSIETSCDETALSVIDAKNTNERYQFKILANAIASQIKIHEKYGGVFPMMAKREHSKNIIPLLKKVLGEAGLIKNNTKLKQISEKNKQELQKLFIHEEGLYGSFIEFIHKNPSMKKIDAIAVTRGPGLEPALWVGINLAKALGQIWNIPVFPVNHMEGHILSVLIQGTTDTKKTITAPKVAFPTIALLVSGGHTELVLVKGWNKYTLIGQTRDDAAGEAFDKVARMLGLPYPGGPHISRLSKKYGSKDTLIKLPRPMLKSSDYDFSFSGLKTAVLYAIKKIPTLTDTLKESIAKEFQDAVIEVLLYKTFRAVEAYGAKTIIVGGGVAANTELKNALMKKAGVKNIKLYLPEKELATDNAIMIGLAGFMKNANKKAMTMSNRFVASGNLSLN